MFGQNRRRLVGAAREATVTTSFVSIVNMSGTAALPGQVLCDEEEPCTDIEFRNVQVSKIGTGTVFAYECSSATGVQEDCNPQVCEWPEKE